MLFLYFSPSTHTHRTPVITFSFPILSGAGAAVLSFLFWKNEFYNTNTVFSLCHFSFFEKGFSWFWNACASSSYFIHLLPQYFSLPSFLIFCRPFSHTPISSSWGFFLLDSSPSVHSFFFLQVYSMELPCPDMFFLKKRSPRELI